MGGHLGFTFHWSVSIPVLEIEFTDLQYICFGVQYLISATLLQQFLSFYGRVTSVQQQQAMIEGALQTLPLRQQKYQSTTQVDLQYHQEDSPTTKSTKFISKISDLGLLHLTFNFVCMHDVRYIQLA